MIARRFNETNESSKLFQRPMTSILGISLIILRHTASPPRPETKSSNVAGSGMNPSWPRISPTGNCVVWILK
jgi:hypothetical protein